jgi:hypothetical protein
VRQSIFATSTLIHINREDDLNLQAQANQVTTFFLWFDGGLKKQIESNRDRYRMIVADAKEREALGLSALPSVETPYAIDKTAEAFANELFQNPDALAYSPRSIGSVDKEMNVKWLTEIVRYRMGNTFPFVTWAHGGIKEGLTDGIQSALVWWRKEFYNKKVTSYWYVDPLGQRKEIDELGYNTMKDTGLPGEFIKETDDVPVNVRDTWWIDSLMPGRDVQWDFKAPLLDVNLGEWCNVRIHKSLQDIQNFADLGVFDKVKKDTLDRIKSKAIVGSDAHADNTKTQTDPDHVDAGDFNRYPLNIFFWKDKNQWKVQFSIDHEIELSSWKSVDEVFFNNQERGILPVVIGFFDTNIFENTGRSLSQMIAPLEDELLDHRNNLNDYMKQLLRGRWRRSPGSDASIQDILNAPIADYEQGEVELITMPSGSMEVFRMSDTIRADINKRIPAGIEAGGRSIAPKGTDQTLGATQLALQSTDSKQGVMLMIFGETFLKPLMKLIAYLEFAYETDEVVAKLAAGKVRTRQPGPNGQPMPFQPPMDGVIVDFRQLDFDIDVKVNAGLGSIPRFQKAQTIMQISDWRKQNGVPTDTMDVARQLNVLGGLDPDAFTPQAPPPEPKPQVDYKLTIQATMQDLLSFDPNIGQFLVKTLYEGKMDVSTTAETPSLALAKNNGGGMFTADRTGKHVDGTGPEAEGMSRGGQNG